MGTIVLLLVAGAVLLFLETILPGLVAGTVGLACLGSAVFLGYRDFGTETGHLLLLLTFVGLMTGLVLWLRYFPQSRMARWFISDATVGDLGIDFEHLVAAEGVARSALRPSGVATLDGKRYDVVAESGFIDAGTPVKVVAVEGSRVVVRSMA